MQLNRLEHVKNSPDIHKCARSKHKTKNENLVNQIYSKKNKSNFQIKIEKCDDRPKQNFDWMVAEESDSYSYGSSSGYIFPISPSVAGYRSPKKKQKEEKEFNEFIEKQEKILSSYCIRTKKDKKRKSKKQPTPHSKQTATGYSSMNECQDSNRFDQSQQRQNEIWDIVLSNRDKGKREYKNFEVKKTLTQLKKKFKLSGKC